jgi:NAD(P)-dependent dehydrogenase (short-subunit alcohol dehydrogenase family)
MSDAAQKIAVVTGANKGIGLATARQLAQAGVMVLIGARDRDRGLAAVEAMARDGLSARWLPLDVTDSNALAAAAASVEQDFGRLDILVNNAGIGLDFGTAGAFTDAALRKTMDSNFFGAFAATTRFLPLLHKSPAGRIVNISCQLGSCFHTSDPQWAGYAYPFAAYSISKAALNMMTIQFANELKNTNIKINSVDPGYTDTDLTAGNGTAQPEDSAKVVVRYALLDESGPNGGYFNDSGKLPW